MLSAFYFLLLIAFALIAMQVVYGTRRTLPNYEGPGGGWLLVLSAAAGIGLVYVIGWITGHSFPGELNTMFQFGTHYTGLIGETWFMAVGLFALVAVGLYNVLRYGRVNM